MNSAVKAWMMAMALVALFSGGAVAEDLYGAAAVAAAHGLRVEEVGSYDEALCARLIRHGKVYVQRGRYQEAKRTFLKAVLVDPSSALAWKYYDMSVVGGLAERVEENPGLIDRPKPGEAAPEAGKPEVEEGC